MNLWFKTKKPTFQIPRHLSKKWVQSCLQFRIFTQTMKEHLSINQSLEIKVNNQLQGKSPFSHKPISALSIERVLQNSSLNIKRLPYKMRHNSILKCTSCMPTLLLSNYKLKVYAAKDELLVC